MMHFFHKIAKTTRLIAVLGVSLSFFACGSDDNSSTGPEIESSSSQKTIVESSDDSDPEEDLPDYSPAIRMNKLIGQGINFGNAWDAGCNSVEQIESGNCHPENFADDNGWNNGIKDEWFKIVRDAGFKSIRLPIRWDGTALNEPPYTLLKTRVEGVKEDVRIANSLGMPVIINQHHYVKLYANPDTEAPKFYAMWEQIAKEFKDFPDDSLVFEVLNESRENSDKVLSELVNNAIKIIRKTNPTRTIMINPGNWGKFEKMADLDLPKDGNLIISGHYYEPFGYSHQGHNSECLVTWDASDQNAKLDIVKDFKSYVSMAKAKFPGKNGTYIPLNMGEFGASSRCENVADEANRASYLATILEVANGLGISWNLWGFTGVDFNSYDKFNEEWYPTMLATLQKFIEK